MKSMKFFLLACGLLALSACTQDGIVPAPAASESGKKIRLVFIADRGGRTKTQATETGSLMQDRWDNDETLYVFGNENGYVGFLNCTTAEGQVSGDFIGDITWYDNDTEYYLYYFGAQDEDLTFDEGDSAKNFYFGRQSGKLDDVPDYDLCWFSVLKTDMQEVDGSYTCSGKIHNKFTSVVKFLIPESYGLGSSKVFVYIDGMSSRCWIDCTENSGQLNYESDIRGIDITDAVVPGTPFYVVVPISDVSGGVDLTWNFVIASGTGESKAYYKHSLPRRTFLPGKYITANGQGAAVILQPEALPQGALPLPFSVSPTKQVYFSRGNLQYRGDATSPYWRFATYQWNRMRLGPNAAAAVRGNVNLGVGSYNSVNANVPRDLFCWGTTNHRDLRAGSGNVAQQYYYCHQFHINPNYFLNAGLRVDMHSDWGYNAIRNGGNTQNSGWRLLSYNESWGYLIDAARAVFYNGEEKGGKNAKSKGVVNGVEGLIVLPDDFHLPEGMDFTLFWKDYTANAPHYNATEWELMELHGAVFLPAAGAIIYNSSSWVLQGNTFGPYWTSTYGADPETPTIVTGLSLGPDFQTMQNTNARVYDGEINRNNACAVRLVRDVQ